jgi:hypothetical protein
MTRHFLAAVALAALCAGNLAGCGEKRQRLSPEPGNGYNSPGADRPLRERTLQQGESAGANY